MENNNIYFFQKQTKDKKIEKCEWSKQLKIYIHRYDSGAKICRCGKDKVRIEIKTGGWRSK